MGVGGGDEAKHSKAYEVFTVGQAKCITYLTQCILRLVGLMTVFFYTAEEMVQSG